MLTLIILLPAILGAITCFALPAKHVKYGALAVTIIDLLLVLFAAGQFDWSGTFSANVPVFAETIQSSFQMRQHIPWLPSLGISWTVGVDNLSMVMIILTAALGIFGVLCSWNTVEKREKEFFFFLMLLQTGIMGTFLSLDMFLFYLFWELMLIPLYFLIGVWGSKNRLYATMKFVLYTLLGSLLMLLALIWMYFNNGVFVEALNATEYVRTFSYELLLDTQTNPIGMGTFQGAMFPFLALFLAFAIKIPLFPLHTWLPDAHTEAPTAASMILAGVLLKTGAYGMLRFCLPLFPDASVDFAPIVIWLSVIAIIYGAMAAIVQTDVKRLVAYSSVSHMGFIVLGIFSMNPQGMSGAVLQMVNHGISTSGLFLAVGMIYERTHTREMKNFGGLATNMPIYAALTMVMVLSSVGLPGLNGFMGEFPILLGSMHCLPMMIEAQDPTTWGYFMGMTNYTWVITMLAASGIIFGAVYLLVMVKKVFYGKLDEEKNGGLKDLDFREWGQLAVLSVAALVIGLFPRPFFKALEPATNSILGSLSGALGQQIELVEVAGVDEAMDEVEVIVKDVVNEDH
jgi:NADH-quinone oxidoreductase subunit M